MLSSRRRFLQNSLASLSLPILLPEFLDSLERRLEPFASLNPTEASRTAEFWAEIRGAFEVSGDFINLENGYSSLQPKVTLEAFQKRIAKINRALSYYMRRQKESEQDQVLRALASLAGCPPEELSLTRNTTESMATVIHGLDFKPGDEAIMTNQDYGSMLEEFRQQSKRQGIRCVEINLPLHPKDDDEVVEAYQRAITPRTRILLLTHMINTTGQILPAQKISAMAHSYGVEVLIDAAHSFAHIVFNVPDLGGDYFGTSLHKWLCTPLGAGLLQIRKEKIKHVWPLYGETSVPDDDMRKFHRSGTQPAWILGAITEAIRFHRMIGSERKEERLRYLQEYWTGRAREIPRVTINTPGGKRACAIANFSIEGRSPGEIADLLFDRHRIFTVAIDIEALKGVRVTPHLYTDTGELDHLVTAIGELAA
jgi:selenocysteine lyase/cysteine desulfurase